MVSPDIMIDIRQGAYTLSSTETPLNFVGMGGYDNFI